MEGSSSEHPCSRNEIEKLYPKALIKEEDLKVREILDYLFEYKRNGEIRTTKSFKLLVNNKYIILYLMEFLKALNSDKSYEASEELKQKIEDSIIELLSLKTTIVNNVESSRYDYNKYTPLGYAFKNHMSRILDALLSNKSVDVNKRCQMPYNPFPTDRTYYNPLLLSLESFSLDNESILNGSFMKILQHPQLKLETVEIEYILISFMKDSLAKDRDEEELIKRIEILEFINNKYKMYESLSEKITNSIDILYNKLQDINSKDLHLSKVSIAV